MTLSEDLKMLAKGFHPLSGEPLDDGSIAHRPDAIRLLFLLAEEFE